MAGRSPAPIRIALLAGIIAAVGGVITVRALRPEPSVQPAAPPVAGSIPPPPFVESEYLNTRPDASYVGTAACVGCHKANHDSYLLTPHSKALADLDPAAEPPDGTYEHKASGRTYRVYRENGKLRHEETLRDPSGRVVARVDMPIKYVIGSGHFCRSYLVEADGFLDESPITWYTGRSKYDMSPGYDFPTHWSFERPITHGCMKCHCGGVSAEGTVHKLTVREAAVGCENCHGPGSKHVELMKTKKLAPGEADLTIVNPSKLPRPLMEAICGECHLGSAASVRLRGRGPDDYRPGMPLSNQRIDYRFAGAEGSMTVTGHLEQLRLSKCYINSNLSCLTCHDPHARQKPADPVAFHKQQCLSCHKPESCHAAATARAATKPADNCVTCHMPRGDTDIPHLAFTHHRIGIHDKKANATPTDVPELEPMDDESKLSPADRKRNLALAYVAAHGKRGYEKFATEFEDRARSLFEEAYRMGLRDPETTQWLARLNLRHDPDRAADFARQVLEAPNAHPEMRSFALMMLANLDNNEHRYGPAIEKLRELVKLRRQADDWRFLGDCLMFGGDAAAAADAYLKAVEIRPFRPKNHAGLAEAYRRLGKTPQFQEQQALADWLQAAKQE
jgi:hypothetical protein